MHYWPNCNINNFSIIGNSETRFLKDKPPTFDFSIKDYSVEHTPIESSTGGALLYISNCYSYLPRNDLSSSLYQSKYLESVFVELVFTKKTNIIVGTIYKHPDMSIDEFNLVYLSPFLQNVCRENKTLYLLADFNINLIKASENPTFSNLLDLLGLYLLFLSSSFLKSFYPPGSL